ncbi:MAG: hypothetical protein HC817_10635 [Saprospiraceae bacterium]|nr:hypothetical protein [Saprospiraceae bacterium]
MNGPGSAFNTGESITTWNTGNTAIPLGSIVNFQNVNSPTPIVNFGTAETTGNAGIAAGGDAIYIYLGSNANTPTLFISAVMNNTPAVLAASLDNTGLSVGSTALVLLPANLDIAFYKGARSADSKTSALTLINDIANNWVSQDGGGDQHNDGIAPDVPFSAVPFIFGGIDNLAPNVSSITIQNPTTLIVTFSELITGASASTLSNYTFTPSLTIQNLAFDSVAKTATLTVPTLEIGRKYLFSGNGFVDLANNTQTTPSVFDNLYFNNYAAGDLLISEIMYNVGANGDSLEFVEIYNRGTSTIPLGGLRFTTGIVGTFPQYALPTRQAVCIAADSAAFRRFYGVPAIGRWSSDFLGNGGEKIEIQNTLNAVVDSLTYDDVAPWPSEADGTGPSLEIINPATDNAVASNWRASITSTGKQFGTVTIFASPNVLPSPPLTPSINFAARSLSINENGTAISVNVTITNPNGQSSKVDIVPVSGTAIVENDLQTAPITPITFSGDTSAAMRTMTFNVLRPNNDTLLEADEYFTINLRNATNATIGRDSVVIIFIQDDDRKAPNRTNELELKLLNSYKNTPATGANSAEIVAYDKTSKRLFIANSLANRLDIIDFKVPATPTAIRSIDLRALGNINAVAVRNNIIVAAVEDTAKIANGRVVFFDTAGTVLKTLTGRCFTRPH